jgi:hypothetical protein
MFWINKYLMDLDPQIRNPELWNRIRILPDIFVAIEIICRQMGTSTYL